MDGSAHEPSFAVRAAVVATLVLGALFGGVHVLVVRSTAYPAGAGVAVTPNPLSGGLADPTALRLSRPPNLADSGDRLTITAVFPGSGADRAGAQAGDEIVGLRDRQGRRVDIAAASASTASARLAAWRESWWLDVRQPFGMTVRRGTEIVDLDVTPQWFPDVSAEARRVWLQRHLGVAVQMVALLASAATLVLLRVRGWPAALMTVALVNVSIGGALVGGEAWLPQILGQPVAIFGWLITPIGFPIVGLTVLVFPTPSPLLSRWPKLPWVLAALASPLFAANALAVSYLAGADAVAPVLTWVTTHVWLWAVVFIVALGVNILIILEGVRRYRTNPDANERRRIQMVVYTGVPASFAWAVAEGVPLASAVLLGRTVEPPWQVSAVLQALVLLPAIGVPYAVAVKHVFSPRTVLRRSLQYALARRTLTVVTLLPAVPLVASIVQQRDLPLASIVTGRPLFYAAGIGVLVLARRYGDRAARWLDRRFFRAEYDAREVLVSLSERLPFETDPHGLVTLVLDHVERALHPASTAVLMQTAAGRFDTIGGRGTTSPPSLPASAGLAMLLQWSRQPLEVFLDDERSAAARLPDEDRAWLAAAGVNLLVPILGGTAETPALFGCLALGPRRSEEPYAPDDRTLLSAIAAQMAVGLDRSRLTRASTPAAPSLVTTSVVTPTLGCCPTCRRCVPLDAGRCPDHPTVALTAVPGLTPVVDGKYRIEAFVGRGGMGTVYRARDLRLERDVAVKVLRSELTASADARARFQREALVVARLQHPAVVAIYDVGTLADGASYLVMEFVRGEDLRQRLARGPLPAHEAVDVIAGVAAGVQAAHDAGVFHRDLKPENVLLPGAGLTPKVLDFGVAKLAGPSVSGTITTAGTITGTPAYMAPEQLRGDATAATDVFSLGVMTFELLTGSLPFGAGSLADIAVAHARGDVGGVDRMPEALRVVVLSALAPSPGVRPASPAVFAAALRAALS